MLYVASQDGISMHYNMKPCRVFSTPLHLSPFCSEFRVEFLFSSPPGPFPMPHDSSSQIEKLRTTDSSCNITLYNFPWSLKFPFFPLLFQIPPPLPLTPPPQSQLLIRGFLRCNFDVLSRTPSHRQPSPFAATMSPIILQEPFLLVPPS